VATAGSAVFAIESDCWIATYKERQGPFGALTPLVANFFNVPTFQRNDETARADFAVALSEFSKQFRVCYLQGLSRP